MKGLIFTYLLTYGGAAASLLNPYWGLLVYICFAIVKPESMWYWSVPQGNYSRIVGVALLLGWALHGFGNWNLGRAWAVVAALIGFWAWAAISAAGAPDQAIAWGFIETKSKIFLPFLVGITTIDSVTKLKQLAWVIVLSQGYVAFELNLAYYDGFNRVTEAGFGGMDNNSVAIAMVTGVGTAFFLGLEAPGWWRKALAFAAAALMAHTVLFAFSRGGMLALILTGGMAFVLIPKRPKHYLALLLAILLGLRLAGPQVQERFMTSFAEEDVRDASAQSRLELWAACWNVMCQEPLGIGPDHWALVAHQYGFKEGKEAHSLWLQTGGELGFPGMLCLLFFYGLCILQLWPLARGRSALPAPWYRDAARMTIASLTGFMVAAQFVSIVGLELPYYIALIGAGVLKLATMPPWAAAALPAISALQRRAAPASAALVSA
jgi:probable O-glycosylation ligase (exosortase A-associated)